MYAKINTEQGLLKQVAAGLRQEATPAERKAWALLRGRRFMGRKFRRQHVIEGKIVDFYCHELRLCVELDGQPHVEPEGRLRDQIRDGMLRAKGYEVVRFMNEELIDLPAAFKERLSKLCSSPPL
jgi:very-short-patch-repair endonuclease